MEKEAKTALITAGAAFAAGVAVTLTVLALCFCPMKPARGLHGAERPGIMQRQPERFGAKNGEFYGTHSGRKSEIGDMRRHKRPRFHPGREMKERFAQKLALSEEQKAQIEKFRREDMAKMAPLLQQMDALREQADKLREENRQRFESLLTAEQKETLKKMHHEHWGKNEKRKGTLRERPLPGDFAGKAGDDARAASGE